MITTTTRLRLQDICQRIALGKSVTLAERIEPQKFADRDRSVLPWMNLAQRRQQHDTVTWLDKLMIEIDLGSSDPYGQQHPEDDLGEWFSNADPWLRMD